MRPSPWLLPWWWPASYCSSKQTALQWRFAAMALQTPMTPPPTTMTSYFFEVSQSFGLFHCQATPAMAATAAPRRRTVAIIAESCPNCHSDS